MPTQQHGRAKAEIANANDAGLLDASLGGQRCDQRGQGGKVIRFSRTGAKTHNLPVFKFYFESFLRATGSKHTNGSGMR